MDNPNELSQVVLGLVESHYSVNHSSPLLLSLLGAKLGAQGHKLPGGEKLRSFIEHSLGDKLVIIQHPKVQQYLAVAPIEREEEVRQAVATWRSPSVAERPHPSTVGIHSRTWLHRLIEAQPEEIKSKMLIPADIALWLERRR